MVSYCCVNGCGNTSKNKNKNPNSAVSFHVFPANKELRSKWLRAIGRSNWSPSNHARVCSAHFTYDQINHDGIKIRIKDDAVPVLLLPLNSNFVASNVEACRICLAIDVKLFSLQDTHLGTYMKSIAGLSLNGIDLEDMPQYVCYQCAPSLIKCKQLIEKCITSQATLLDIFTKNGQISKDLIKEQNGSQPILKSLKNSFVLNDYLLKYDDDKNTSLFTTADSKDSDDDTNMDADMYFNSEECEVVAKESEFHDVAVNDDDVVEEIEISSSYDDIANGDLSKDLGSNAQKEEKYERQIMHTKKLSGEKTNNMLKYFNIVQSSSSHSDTAVQDTNLRTICEKCGVECATDSELCWHMKSEHPRLRDKDGPSRGYPADCELCGETLPNRMKHWHHARKHHPDNTDTYKRVQTITCICDTCGKGFQNATKLRLHQLRHRSPSVRCPYCPRLFYDKYLLAVHAPTHDDHRPHRCCTCGASFKQRRNLDKHYTVHSDIASFECTICGNKFKYSTSLKYHVNYVHNKIPYPKRKRRIKSVKKASDS